MVFPHFQSVWHVLKDRKYRRLTITTLTVLGIGTTFFHFTENWRWLDALYFSVISLTTVGYGDFTPHRDISKIFTMIYLFTGIGILLSFLEAVTSKRKSLEGQGEDKKKNNPL
jgi:hypothetical protein